MYRSVRYQSTDACGRWSGSRFEQGRPLRAGRGHHLLNTEEMRTMNDTQCPGFERHDLDEACQLFSGYLPPSLLPDGGQFENLWLLHPDGYNVIPMAGGPVQIPRYQQAFERAYRFSSRVHIPLPAPPSLLQFLTWGKSAVDERPNGVLVNWHDGQIGHYIGAH